MCRSLFHKLNESKKIEISSCLLPVSPADGEGLCDLYSTAVARANTGSCRSQVLAGEGIHVAGKRIHVAGN